MRITFQRTAKCGIINYTSFFKTEQLRTEVCKQVILRTMMDKVPASSARNMALPNSTYELGAAYNTGHVPEAVWEPALCISCISMSQFGYSRQFRSPFQVTQRSSHSQPQMCKNFLQEHRRLQENKAKVYRTRSLFRILLNNGIAHLTTSYLRFILLCS